MKRVGWRVKFEDLPDGSKKVLWRVLQFKNEVAKGVAKNAKAAKEEAATALGKAMLHGRERAQTKGLAKMKLQYLGERRPYLVLGTCELVFNGRTRKNIVKEARLSEKRWQEKDAPDSRREIPTHHRTLEPEEVASRVLNSLVVLGWATEEGGTLKPVGRQLSRWIDDFFGEGLFDFGTEEAEEESGYSEDDYPPEEDEESDS